MHSRLIMINLCTFLKVTGHHKHHILTTLWCHCTVGPSGHRSTPPLNGTRLTTAKKHINLEFGLQICETNNAFKFKKKEVSKHHSSSIKTRIHSK